MEIVEIVDSLTGKSVTAATRSAYMSKIRVINRILCEKEDEVKEAGGNPFVYEGNEKAKYEGSDLYKFNFPIDEITATCLFGYLSVDHSLVRKKGNVEVEVEVAGSTSSAVDNSANVVIICMVILFLFYLQAAEEEEPLEANLNNPNIGANKVCYILCVYLNNMFISQQLFRRQ